jgi:flagellar biogenesis protein FliO
MPTLAAPALLLHGLLLQASGIGAGGYAADLLRVLFALAAVCLLAWGSLKLLAARGLPLGRRAGANVEVLERVALEQRRSLYLVRAGSRVLLLGVGEGGAPQLVAELDPADLEESAEGQAASAVRQARAASDA